MHLIIITPTELFLERRGVERVSLETSEGSFSFLPRRLDCGAALVPGILVFKAEGREEEYAGLAEGLFVKVGKQIKIATHQAVYSKALGELKMRWRESLEESRAREEKSRLLLDKLRARL